MGRALINDVAVYPNMTAIKPNDCNYWLSRCCIQFISQMLSQAMDGNRIVIKCKDYIL